ncbi:MAG: hypothetical protein HOQ22_19110 [Nocardioidaceae bacterium]|nr:hypothetical protein [Nocardioidaceae bacterium]NUS53135.1 hypothetical protein [Nocardioidaceae bacterium]
MTDGGDRLERAAGTRREAEGLRARLKAATTYADQTTRRVVEARVALAEEERDVARLDGLSWSRILTSLRGDRVTAQERERAERDAARYTLADAQTRDELAWRDVQGVQAQLDALGDVEAEYAAALTEREEWSTAHDPERGRALTEVAERRGLLLAEDTEGREAYDAGAVARDHLRHALGLLGSARSWSTWDTFGGGGMLTDMMKYDKLDQVTAVLRQADLALGRFTRELADLRLGGVEAVNLDSMTQVFDVFFDNIFTDLRVRSRIQDAELRVGAALQQVETTMNRLSLRGREITAELEQLAHRREEILLS